MRVSAMFLTPLVWICTNDSSQQALECIGITTHGQLDLFLPLLFAHWREL